MGTYAPIDYVIYSGILLLVYFFFVKIFFSRIKIDKKFILAISPFILFGVFVRIFVDLGLFEESKYWSITPGVYLLSISFAVISILIGIFLNKKINKKIEYWLFPFFIGFVASCFFIFKLFSYLTFPERIFYPFFLSFLLTFFIYLFSSSLSSKKLKIFRKVDNLAIIFAHLLDGFATFLAYNFYGFGEEHLLPQYLFNLFGNNALVMVPVKLILALSVLYLIENYAENEDEKNVIKLLIFILGIGPGLRNTILPSLRL